MRSTISVAAMVLVGLLASTGCEKGGSGGGAGGTGATGGGGATGGSAATTVDTGKLQSAFSNAEPDLKTQAGRAIDAIKAGNWQQAGTELQGLLSNVKLTPEQKQAVQDAFTSVKDKLTGAGKDALQGAKDGAGKAVDDVKKNLPPIGQ
jgi:hypothetical protein